jgi:hypothetical protein
MGQDKDCDFQELIPFLFIAHLSVNYVYLPTDSFLMLHTIYMKMK